MIKIIQTLIGGTLALGMLSGLVIAPALFFYTYAAFIEPIALVLGGATMGLGVLAITLLIIDILWTGL